MRSDRQNSKNRRKKRCMDNRPGKSEVWRHIAVGLLSGILLIGGPAYAAYGPSGALSADAVSSATTITAQPSGAYVVLINKERHIDEENLATWISFFSGEETDFLFEDISCSVPATDESGLTLAENFQARLPENQMSLRRQETTLLMSKAMYGGFDVIFLSKEMYDACGAKAISKLPFVVTVESEGLQE